jgi:hypothetical protein
MRLRALASGLAALATVVALVAAGAAPAAARVRADPPDPAPFTGLGAWISVFEYVPAFLTAPGPPTVVPDTVHDLAALGARTLYLQAAIDDPRAPNLIVNRTLVSEMLRRAHADGLRVVAWYYPQLVDPARDEARLDALARFQAHGQRFDGVALDIESRQVADVTDRNRRLVAVARQLRSTAPNLPIGAIVYPAVQLEVVNPVFWPQFPYRALAKSVTVWLPMTYWTDRTGVYRDAFRYTDESIRRLRVDLGDRHALVAPIGGLAGDSTPTDYVEFAQAVHADHAIGRSVYDAVGTATTAWPYLRSP